MGEEVPPMPIEKTCLFIGMETTKITNHNSTNFAFCQQKSPISGVFLVPRHGFEP